MLFKKSVDSIMSSINKNIRELQNFAEDQRTLSQVESALAKKLEDSIIARNKEARRAEVVAEKLEQLIA